MASLLKKVILARPDKSVGRIVLGPRPVKNGYARIVATADGCGRIEVFDAAGGVWQDALGTCTFDELWRAAAIFDMRYLRALTSVPDGVA
jgi:hypothetical protein